MKPKKQMPSKKDKQLKPGKKKFVKNYVLLVPWFNKAEWEEVYKKIFSTSCKDRQWALDRITVWKSRSHPGLPTGIETTEALVRAQLQDLLSLEGHASCQSSDISLMYSMALVRFVNLVSELGNWYKNGPSMRNIGIRMNVPGWLVDLRHDATHSIMPSLGMLQSGATYALGWLKLNYWEKERKRICDCTPESPEMIAHYDEKDIRKYLEAYLSQRKDQALYTKDNLRNSPRKKAARQTFSVFQMVLKRNPEQFIQVLVKPGYLVPRSFEVLYPQGLKEGEEAEITEEYESLWVPVLSWIVRRRQMNNLLQALIDYRASKKNSHRHLATLWARRILEVLITKGYPIDSTGSPESVAEAKPCDIQWKHLLRTSILSANKYSPLLITLIASQAGFFIPSTKLQNLASLTAIYLGMTIEGSDDNTKNVKVSTTYDIHALRTATDSQTNADPSDTNGWQICKDPIDWSKFPLGVLPSAVDYDGVHGLELHENRSLESVSDEQPDIQNESETIIEDGLENEGVATATNDMQDDVSDIMEFMI